MRRWLFAVVFSGFAIAVALGLLLDPPVMSASAAQPTPLSEPDAVAAGIREAQRLGLQGTPTSIAARQMTLGEFAHLIDAEIPPSAAKVGLDPAMPVWVVAMRGSVDLRGRVPGTSQRWSYDNVYLALDAYSGRVVMGPGARNPGVPLPIPVP